LASFDSIKQSSVFFETVLLFLHARSASCDTFSCRNVTIKLVLLKASTIVLRKLLRRLTGFQLAIEA
jgi:hypothetical protein